MQPLIILSFTLFLISCSTSTSNESHPLQTESDGLLLKKSEIKTNKEIEVVSKPPRDLEVSEINYNQTISKVTKLKNQWSEEEAINSIQHLVTDSLAPYWYGTPWDFNGMATVPQKGQIACGYFVYTLLEDIGFKLQRIKLSQATSEASIKTLISEEYIMRFSGKEMDVVIQELLNNGSGLYLIGLDYHIGMLEVINGEVWFIHSNYYYPHCVVREKAEVSVALATSNYRIIGKLNNPETINKWLSNTSFYL